MRVPCGVSLVLCTALTLPGQVVDRTADDHSPPKLELRLFAVKQSILTGEKLQLRVELWNVGTEDVIVAQRLDSKFGNSGLSLSLSTDHGGESVGTVGDRFPDSSEPDFEQTFVSSWLTLNKNHFLGTYIYMDPTEFRHLSKPGRYRIHAQYQSRGISSTSGWNGNFLKQSDIDKLPVRAFAGALDSNDVDIQVTARKHAPK